MWSLSFLGGAKPHLSRRDRRRLKKQNRTPTFAPRLEVMEDRTMPSTFMVENLADSGQVRPTGHRRQRTGTDQTISPAASAGPRLTSGGSGSPTT